MPAIRAFPISLRSRKADIFSEVNAINASEEKEAGSSSVLTENAEEASCGGRACGECELRRTLQDSIFRHLLDLSIIRSLSCGLIFARGHCEP